MKLKSITSILLVLALCISQNVSANEKDERTVVCHTEKGMVEADVISSNIIRIRYTRNEAFKGNGSISCSYKKETDTEFSVKRRRDEIRISTERLRLSINTENGDFGFTDAKGNNLLKESGRTDGPFESEERILFRKNFSTKNNATRKTADGEKAEMKVTGTDTLGMGWKYRLYFNWQDGEALYGLGSHMEDYMNLRGKEMFVVQHNLKTSMPVLVSTAGYGLLFDHGCGMKYDDREYRGCVELEAANEVDMYFIYGPEFDDIAAGYRWLTGKAPVMPKYMFGYIQSRERYTTQDEITDIVRTFREKHIPLDLIVQDWMYWPKGWGAKNYDPRRYPDPKKMIDEIHGMNAHYMISIWPNISGCEESDDMARRGFMLGGDTYNAYDDDASEAYWKYAYDGLFKYGVDAWWCDCSEPIDSDWRPGNISADDQKTRYEGNLKALTDLLGPLDVNTYSLHHSKGVYENQRKCTEEKRVVNLTRSSWAGQQRYGTISWNGDTSASWESFAQQIPAGLNFMATGYPYWTVDAGAFFTAGGNEWFRRGVFPQGYKDAGYREFYSRMLQYCTFLPIFRSHGTGTPREPWFYGKEDEPFYESIMTSIKTRYRLLPYIYSLAGGVYLNDYTMTRALAFDFRKDTAVYDIKDEFMFGPSILVCPVTHPMYYLPGGEKAEDVKKCRSVYLPKDGEKNKSVWYDFWSGKEYKGGTTFEADAPIDRIPLFIRAGSIIPIGPEVEYSSQKNDAEWEIRIYPGKDGTFTVYEDEGDNYNYEKGAFSTFTMKWNDKKRTLHLSARKGEYKGMCKTRKLNVVVVSEGCGTGIENETDGVEAVYEGKEMDIRL